MIRRDSVWGVRGADPRWGLCHADPNWGLHGDPGWGCALLRAEQD
ncbi:hypothetical protein ACFWBX_08810 [Streptomyces sp. NPDC059991]